MFLIETQFIGNDSSDAPEIEKIPIGSNSSIICQNLPIHSKSNSHILLDKVIINFGNWDNNEITVRPESCFRIDIFKSEGLKNDNPDSRNPEDRYFECSYVMSNLSVDNYSQKNEPLYLTFHFANKNNDFPIYDGSYFFLLVPISDLESTIITNKSIVNSNGLGGLYFYNGGRELKNNPPSSGTKIKIYPAEATKYSNNLFVTFSCLPGYY